MRTAPAYGIDWPHAAQVLRICRDTGPTHGPWTGKEIAYGITVPGGPHRPSPLGLPRPPGSRHREPRALRRGRHPR